MNARNGDVRLLLRLDCGCTRSLESLGVVMFGHRVGFSRYKPAGYCRTDLGQNDKIMG
jgi:hypothetical protein